MQMMAVFVTDVPVVTGVFDGESGARISSWPWVTGISTFILGVVLGEGSPRQNEKGLEGYGKDFQSRSSCTG